MNSASSPIWAPPWLKVMDAAPSLSGSESSIPVIVTYVDVTPAGKVTDQGSERVFPSLSVSV